jgi:hypothetical protein
MPKETTIVIVETMPAHLQESHRAAGNWGVYPHNGAVRTEMSLQEASDVIAADTFGYARIVKRPASGE